MNDKQYKLITNSVYGSDWITYTYDKGNNTYESYELNLRCIEMVRAYYSGIISTFPKDIMLEMLRIDILPIDLRNKLVYGK